MIEFKDTPDTSTPINATNLNKIQTDLLEQIGDITTLETTEKSNLVGAINEIVEDTGWIEVTDYDSKFTSYDVTQKPKYRRIGKVVQLVGACKPTETMTAAVYTMFTIPEGFRPNSSVSVLCQGSGRNKWLCMVNDAGQVQTSRHGASEAYVDYTTSSWLPFSIVYFVD